VVFYHSLATAGIVVVVAAWKEGLEVAEAADDSAEDLYPSSVLSQVMEVFL